MSSADVGKERGQQEGTACAKPTAKAGGREEDARMLERHPGQPSHRGPGKPWERLGVCSVNGELRETQLPEFQDWQNPQEGPR